MLGLQTQVSIGLQSAAGNPTLLNRQSLNIYGISGGQTEADTDDNILGGVLENDTDPVAPAPGLDDHKLTVKAPLCAAQLGFWMAAFFGAGADTGADPDYVHTFTSGQELPLVFLEHRLGPGRYRRHWGLVGESITVDLDAEREGFAVVEMTFVGLGEVSDTVVLDGEVDAAPTLDRPAQKLVAGLYNGVAGGDLMGGKFTFTRQVKRFRGADGTGSPYAVAIDNTSSLTGSIRARFQDDAFVDDAVAKTERPISLQLLRVPTRSVAFDIAHQRLQRTPVGVDSPGGLEMNFDFRGWQTADNPVLTARVLNGSPALGLPESGGSFDFSQPGNPAPFFF